MDEHVVGMSAGESKEFTTVIPTDYSNEKIAGKEAHYAVTLYKVETKEMPELDDAFASQASNGEIETLEDLRKAISDNILDVKKRRIRDELREKVLTAVIDQSQITIHPLLIQEEAEEMLHQLSHMLEEQRMSMDQYLMMIRKTREEYLQDIQPDAEKRVRRQLVLDAVAEKESIGILPEEVEALFRAYAQAGQELPRSDAQIRALATSYRREKAIARLLELTTDPDPDTASAEEEEATEIASAQAAALAGDTVVADSEEQAGEEVVATEESAAPIAHETNTDVVE
jgi:trigger factor